MSIVFDELISDLLFAPDYLPDVLQWARRQLKENGHMSRDCLKKILQIISFPCWKKFLQAIEGPCELTQDDLAAAEYKLLTGTGIASVESVRLLGKSEKAYNLTVTESAKQIFATFDLEQFKYDKLKSSAVHLVAVAAVNAYGVIEKSSFIDLFNKYMKKPAEGDMGSVWTGADQLDPDELDSILAPYTEMNIDVLLLNGYLVNRMLYNGSPDDIAQFLSKVSMDKYYLFDDIESLLVYANSNYFEETPQIAAFLGLLEGRFPELTKVDLHLIGILFAPCYLNDWSQLIEVQLCPIFESVQREERREMAEAFVRAKRSARSWQHRGFSDDEIDSDGEGFERDVREFLTVMGDGII